MNYSCCLEMIGRPVSSSWLTDDLVAECLSDYVTAGRLQGMVKGVGAPGKTATLDMIAVAG